MNESKTLCVMPWVHRYTNEQGWHQMCCSGDGAANMLHDVHGKALHASQALTDDQILNSADLKAVRVAMLKGEWPAACERCRRTEEAGAVSSRHHYNSRFGHWRESVLSRTAPDGKLDRPQVRYLDIRLGNVCNLTCRMCGPGAARLWTDHYNAVQPRRYLLPASYLTAMRNNNWVKSQPVRQIIEQCLPSVESLHFAGGEPLIIPEMIEALDLCVSSGRADQIDLSYNTNITVLPERVTRFWPHFRSVSLLCSVDGIGALNDYIRRPSKWGEIERNLHILDQRFHEWKLRSVLCHTTVQIYNVLQLGELFDYFATRFQNVTPLPLLNPLYYPGYLSIRILPARVKDAARERLVAERSKAEALRRPDLDYAVTAIDAVIAHMDAPSISRELPDFLYFSEKSDREFGDSWRRACPELARLLLAQTPAEPAAAADTAAGANDKLGIAL